MTDTPSPAWICPICGFIHYGAEPPEECPICGTSKDQFEAYVEAAAAPVASTAAGLRLVIAGAGIAGVSTAEAARRANPQAEISLLSNEADLPYYRMSLTRFLAGELSGSMLDLHPESWYAENGIRLLCGVEFTGVDSESRELLLAGGQRLGYDSLVLATGARPFVPPINGAGKQGVTTLRTRVDAEALLQAALGGAEIVCIGGGLLGLETAGALARRGAAVTVVENQAWLMPRQLNATAAALFQRLLKPMGIAVRTNARTRELVGDAAVRGVQLEDGPCLSAGVVVISAGVRANTDLARQAGLGANQGILVDGAMRTSRTEIFAAGDAAEHQGTLYGTWAPAQVQGGVAGANAAGQSASFKPLPRSNTLKVLGIDLFSIGLTAPANLDDRMIEAQDERSYRGFVLRGGRLVGAILLGDAAPAAAVKQAVEEGLDCSALLAGKPGVKEILQWVEESKPGILPG